jgi:hypothetical protein
MSDRSDSNWGSHGNPNRPEWYTTKRELPEYRHDHIFIKQPIKISVWNLFLIFMGFLFITAIIPEFREWVYGGIEFTQRWYDAVDSILDALGAPKLP